MIRRFFLARLIAMVILGFVFVFFWGAASWAPTHLQTVLLRGPVDEEAVIDVTIADTEEERARGLMFMKDLPEGQGMFFVFPTPQPQSFWMKNTFIPLDILFFNGEGKFLSRASMEPCEEDPCPHYASNGSAMYALEVNRGEPLTEDVDAGWTIVPPEAQP